MKRLVLTYAIFGVLTMSALADEPPPIIPPLQPAPYHPVILEPPALVWEWTGLYAGVNGGWIGSSGLGRTLANTGTDTGGRGLGSDLVAGVIPASLTLSNNGFIGGVQVGLNWQAEFAKLSWVLGIEADFDGEAGGSNSVTSAFNGSSKALPLSITYSRQLDTLGTVRGRLGYLITPDQLWYLTGGLAYSQTKIGTSFLCLTCIPSSTTEPSTMYETSNVSTGWTVGAGMEWKFAPRWSVKAEYLYVDLGDLTNSIQYSYDSGVSTLTSTIKERDNIVRIGVNYKLF